MMPGNACSLVASFLLGATVAVAPAEPLPVADAGPDRYLDATTIILDGSGSYDPTSGGTIQSYQWTQVSGPAVILGDADTARPSVTAAPIDDIVQRVVLQLVVGNGSLLSLPDQIVLTVVPSVPGSIRLLTRPDVFDPAKPTVVYFSGGNCVSGGGYWLGHYEWYFAANLISYNYGPPYERCGDALIAYLSRVAPTYSRPIQVIGSSTGGMPAIDAAIRINTVYCDPRYAVNEVVLLDAACRDYDNNIQTFVENPVGDEHAWVENYYAPAGGYARFRPRAINVHFTGDHGAPQQYYQYSTDPSRFSTDVFNHGITAGAFTSVMRQGAHYRPASPAGSPYHFKWIIEPDGRGHMEHFDAASYPARLPAPFELLAPADGDNVTATGAVLSCGSSENAVAYDVLLGEHPGALQTLATFASPPSYATPPLPTGSSFHWTIQARDAFGSVYRPEIRVMIAAPGDITGDHLVDDGDCSLIEAALGTNSGEPGYQAAADYDGNGAVTCADWLLWLADYRAFYRDPARPDPCGLTSRRDSDGDRVPDFCDACPGTIPGPLVDLQGCPPAVTGDLDGDGDVDQVDFGLFQACLTGPGVPQAGPACQRARLDADSDVDQYDLGILEQCARGPSIPADPGCFP